ncbi:hypothetical protein [Nonomuraea sp. NPDC050643]|uniref:hypothetical protein n=1 Tax=Nonomuraea sp. NPDC050643 TaxID=3155660 RepID=UPI0033EC7E3C
MKVWLVWSNEHRAWWGPNFSGYTSDVWTAGRYDEVKALDAAGRRGWRAPNRPADVMVLAPENDQDKFTVDDIRAVPDLMQRRIKEAGKAAVAERRRLAAEQDGEESR